MDREIGAFLQLKTSPARVKRAVPLFWQRLEPVLGKEMGATGETDLVSQPVFVVFLPEDYLSAPTKFVPKGRVFLTRPRVLFPSSKT